MMPSLPATISSAAYVCLYRFSFSRISRKAVSFVSFISSSDGLNALSSSLQRFSFYKSFVSKQTYTSIIFLQESSSEKMKHFKNPVVAATY